MYLHVFVVSKLFSKYMEIRTLFIEVFIPNKDQPLLTNENDKKKRITTVNVHSILLFFLSRTKSNPTLIKSTLINIKSTLINTSFVDDSK